METTRKSLLLRIRNRQDSHAWLEFDRIYRPILMRYARSWGLGADAAEDVVQHCLAAVHKHVDSFEYDPQKGRFKAWLRTLSNNRIRNLRRARREHRAESQDFKRPQTREPSPEERFDQLWLDEHLRFCLQQVREEVEPTTFQAFHQLVFEQQSVESICDSLRMTPNQVYKIKRRLTLKIGEKMQTLVGDG